MPDLSIFLGDKMLRPCLMPTLAICLCAISPAIDAQDASNVRRLSLTDAIEAALKNNLAIESGRNSWRGTREAGTLSEEAAFEYQLSSSFSNSWSQSGGSSILNQLYEGENVSILQDSTSTTNSRNLSASLSKPFQWGGTAQFQYSPRFSSTNQDTKLTLLDPPYTAIPSSPRITPNPYGGSWSFSYSQSLLRSGRKAATAQLVIARRGLVTSDANFRRTLQTQIARIESVYWNLVNAQMSLTNARNSLELAESNLRENKIRAETGILAPIDVVQSEAAVAQREVSVIQAEAGLLNAKDTFIREVYSTTERPDEVELTDAPIVTPMTPTEAAAIETALNNRVELISSRNALEDAKLNEDIAKINLRPTLDASVAYNGGATSASDFGSINSDLFAFRYPGFNINLNFRMPLQNKSARSQDIRARVNRRTAELNLRDQENAIILEVRTAYRNLQTAEKSIIATEKARYHQKLVYDAEVVRFQNEISTSYRVQQEQVNLDNAINTETNARISYANAQTSLQQAMGTLLDFRNIRVQ
jgi:outer membrane protein TolC